MGKGTVTASIVDFQVPDNRREQDDGRIGEEITLFIDPRLIEVQKRDVSAFIGVRNVVHEAGVDGIAAVRLAGIVEVDDAELRFDGVSVQMMQQMIVGDAGKVVELIVVDEHREAFLDVLFDIVVQHGVALARAGSSQNQRRTKRIDDIDPSLPPLRLITITRRKVHRIIIAEATLFLKETFVFIIERIVGKRLFQQAPQPDPGGQQAEIPHSKGRNIAPCPKVGSGRQLQQHAVQKE